MTRPLRYKRKAERPSAKLWLEESDGTLVDFSAGYTFALKVGTPGTTALLTKTTGITGATGAGKEPAGTPNLTVAWSVGELDIEPGTYPVELIATTGGLDRFYELELEIEDTIL